MALPATLVHFHPLDVNPLAADLEHARLVKRWQQVHVPEQQLREQHAAAVVLQAYAERELAAVRRRSPHSRGIDWDAFMAEQVHLREHWISIQPLT